MVVLRWRWSSAVYILAAREDERVSPYYGVWFKGTVHQYDCFDTTQPACRAGNTVFHAECVGDTAKTADGRVFDTIASQFARNGDSSKRIVLKIDVEGAEWDSLLTVPDRILEQIDQIAVEFHWLEDENFNWIQDDKYL